MVKISLLLKSKAQYANTLAELEALGVRLFALGGYEDKSGYGIAYWSDDTATDGVTTVRTTEYTRKSEFISEVQRLQSGV